MCVFLFCRLGIENDIINARLDLFALSPPTLNHSLSFVASNVAMVLDDFGGFNEEFRNSRLFRTFYGCGFFRQISLSSISLTIQPGRYTYIQCIMQPPLDLGSMCAHAHAYWPLIRRKSIENLLLLRYINGYRLVYEFFDDLTTFYA